MASPSATAAPRYPTFYPLADGQILPVPSRDPQTGEHWTRAAFKEGCLAQEQLHPKRAKLVDVSPLNEAAMDLVRAGGGDVSRYLPWIPSPPWGDSTRPEYLGERLVFLAVVANSVPAYRDPGGVNAAFLREVEPMLAQDWTRKSRTAFDAEFRFFGAQPTHAIVQASFAGFWAGPGDRRPGIDGERRTLWQFPPSRPHLQKRFDQGGWLPWNLRERAAMLGDADGAEEVRAEIERGLMLFDDVLTTGERTGWILGNEEALTGLSQLIIKCQAKLDKAATFRLLGLADGGDGSGRAKKPKREKKGPKKSKKSAKTKATETRPTPPPVAPGSGTLATPAAGEPAPPLTAGASGHAEAADPPAPFRPWSWARDNGIPDFPAPRGAREPDLQWWDGYPALVTPGSERPAPHRWSARDGRTSRGNLAYHALRHGASGTVDGYGKTVEALLATITRRSIQGVRHGLYGRESVNGLRYTVDQWIVLTTDAPDPAARRVITAYPLRNNPDRPVSRSPAEAISWPKERQLAYALLGPPR